MNIIKKILYFIGGLALFVLSPMILGAILTWAIGIVVSHCLSILLTQVIIICNPKIKIGKKHLPFLKILFNLIPSAIMERSKSKLELIVIIIAGILGAALLALDIWLLGESLYWIPISVGILLYFIFENIIDNRGKHFDVLDDSNNIELIKTEKECYELVEKGSNYIKDRIDCDDWGIEPLLLCSAILLNFKQSENDSTYKNAYKSLLLQNVLNLHDATKWDYLFAMGTPGACYDNSYGDKLSDFVKKHGKMSICKNLNFNGGKPICVFVDSNYNETWVHFSRNIGYLSAEEIEKRKDKLRVIERDYNYYVLTTCLEEDIQEMLFLYISERLTLYRNLILRINDKQVQDKEIIIKYLYALLFKKQYQLYSTSDIDDTETLNYVENLYLTNYPKEFNNYSMFLHFEIMKLIQFLNKELNK